MVFEAVVLGSLLLAAVLFILRLLYLRRPRAGAIEMSMRLKQRWFLGGWSPGVGTYSGDEILWYRMFSLALRPSRRLNRRQMTLDSQREPTDKEASWLPVNAVILESSMPGAQRDLAVARTALTGMLSWWESAAPGPSLPNAGF